MNVGISFLVAQTVKRLPTTQETQVQSLGQEDSVEKEIATHSSILAWRIPWTEELGGLQSTGRKESDTTERLHFTFTLLLGRKVMSNLDSIFQSRDITLPAKVRLVKAMVFPVVMYGCESGTVKKAEFKSSLRPLPPPLLLPPPPMHCRKPWNACADLQKKDSA